MSSAKCLKLDNFVYNMLNSKYNKRDTVMIKSSTCAIF